MIGSPARTRSATTSTVVAADRATFDRVALALLGVVAVGLATWAAIVEDQFIIWLPVVPHLLILAIGAFLVLRTEARRLGWLLAPSVLFIANFGAGPVFEETGATWAGVVGASAGLWLAPLLVAILVYPTGRFESRILAALGGITVLGVTAAVVNWLGVILGWWDYPGEPEELAIALGSLPLFLSFFEQARIYRRRPLLQQKQVKWYVIGLLAIPMYVIPLVLDWSDEAFAAADAFTTILFPIAILIGITRYRLYEIDRIVSRTVAYVLVLGSLAAVFVGSVALVTTVMPAQDQFAVAATTVAVVALFNPLRRRVVTAVDRRFDRTHYVAQQVVEQFGRTVADRTDLDTVRARVHDVVGTTLAPATVAVWEPTRTAP